jgi:hypothetical protein
MFKRNLALHRINNIKHVLIITQLTGHTKILSLYNLPIVHYGMSVTHQRPHSPATRRLLVLQESEQARARL